MAIGDTIKTKEWECTIEYGGEGKPSIMCERRGIKEIKGVSLFPKNVHITNLKCRDIGLDRLKCSITKKPPKVKKW